MITSLKNPLLKRVLDLRDKKDRDLQQLFAIEGEKEILHAAGNGILLDSVIVAPDLTANNQRLNSATAIQQWLNSLPKPTPALLEVSTPVYQKIACRQSAEGLIALARIPQRQLHSLHLPANPLLLVLHDIEKPGNLGALLRTADGAGVHAVIVISLSGADLYNPNVIRASLGAIFTVPTVSATLDTARQWLKDHHIQTILTTPSATSDYTSIDYRGPVAIVLGSEDKGLPEHWLADDSIKVVLPMCGRMDSLNVSCAGAIMLYEALRQRLATPRQ